MQPGYSVGQAGKHLALVRGRGDERPLDFRRLLLTLALQLALEKLLEGGQLLHVQIQGEVSHGPLLARHLPASPQVCIIPRIISLCDRVSSGPVRDLTHPPFQTDAMARRFGGGRAASVSGP